MTDFVQLPLAIFDLLLHSPALYRADRIWLEQRGFCECGKLILKRPIWLKNEKAVCTACLKGDA